MRLYRKKCEVNIMKNKRQDTLLKMIRENIISTQEDLMNSLLSLGYKVTQSTISRDIKELRIVKALDSEGNYRYTCAFDNGATENDNLGKYADIFSSSVISINHSMNDIVIKCYPGMASGACVAVDSLYGNMILGSLAGDDTIFIITNGEESATELAKELNKML